MRDINRIHPLCQKIEEYWYTWPDLRFGQWTYNFFKWIKLYKHVDPFYVEDDDMLEMLKEYMKEE